MCLGEERQILTSGQAVYIPSGVFHQLTNIGDTPLRMIYVYGPAGDVAHWRQELDARSRPPESAPHPRSPKARALSARTNRPRSRDSL